MLRRIWPEGAGFPDPPDAAMLGPTNPAEAGQQPGRADMAKPLTLGLGLVAAVLTGCTTAPVTGPAQADLQIEQVRLKGEGPPKGPEGACWDKDVTPAVIETVTEQVHVTDEVRDDQGRVVTPATFRTVTSQRMVRDRQEVWFRAPCPAEITVAFVASLQRALKARGLYAEAVTGEWNAATAEAVRRFQAARGLDSPRLSLAAARELGLIAVDVGRL